MQIILASGSPRRRQLLTLAGIPHEVIVSDVDETIEGTPDFQVRELALRKANAVLSLVSPDSEAILIAADTLVYIGGEVLGKPCDSAEAFEMLKKLQGKPHKVYTGVALLNTSKQKPAHPSSEIFVDSTTVHFRQLSDAEIHAYIATGEPFDKAGAYGVQERGAVLVDRVEGDFYTVVGLPISKVCAALTKMGYNIWDETP